jgi:hypothetical protein
MALPSIFDRAVADRMIGRINQLTPSTQPQWGKMDVARMLAHCNVTYELVYDNIHAKPNGLARVLLKLMVKNSVVNETPYKHNLRTGPQFLIVDQKIFETEKKRLVDYINRVQQEGAKAFEGRDSNSFGPLNSTEWNNMFYKHLDHHLSQFGV